MNKEINTIVKINRIIYPRDTIDGECWGVAEVEEIEQTQDNTHSFLIFNKIYKVVGELPKIDFGITYKLIGEMEETKYGESCKIQLMLPYVELKDNNSIKLFLSTFLTPIQTENIISTFDNPLEILKNGDIEKLCTIKGIGKFTANQIIEKYEDNKIYEQALGELAKYNLTPNIIKKIIKHYNSVNIAINTIKNNPYDLTRIDGIGFKKADEIGLKVGIKPNSPNRIKSYILFQLEQQAQFGYSYVNYDTLLNSIENDLSTNEYTIDSLLIKDCIVALQGSQSLYINNKQTIVALQKYVDLEMNIAKELKRIWDNGKELNHLPIEDVIKDIQIKNGWEFTEEQIEASKNILKYPISLIIGGAGSGKTNTSIVALDCLKPYNNIACCAFSGKASARIQEVTGYNASTIHRLLGYDPESGKFSHNKDCQLCNGVVLTDECSFLDLQLFYDLIQSIPNGSKLIMMGDIKQLEALGSGNLLMDIINSRTFSTNILTKIHRQAQKSGIITQSNLVSKSIQITRPRQRGSELYGELQDMRIDIIDNEKNKLDYILNIFKETYNKCNDIRQIQCISPVNKNGELCNRKLNTTIQEWYNGDTNKPSIKLKKDGYETTFRLDDKVICTKNNYKTQNIYGDDTPIFNGFTGIIKEINAYNKSMIIDFDLCGEIFLDGESLQNLDLGYSLSVHRMQGSEANYIIIALGINAYTLLTRQMIYTAITRAKKECILCCENKALRLAINKDNISKKQTFLKLFLQKIFNNKN